MQLLYFLLLTALIDSLNPATIITQLLLLIKTKSLKISASFIGATYFVYLIAGILLYYGITAPLKKWLSAIHIVHSGWLVSIEIILVACAVIFLVWHAIPKEKKNKSLSNTITPLTVVILGVGSTLSDVPTAVPYFAFIARMEQADLAIVYSIACFAAYVFIYILPLLIIHFIFKRNQSAIIQYAPKIETWIDKIGKLSLRIIILAIILFLVTDGIRYFLGMESLLSR
jgi:cytochrome c biogenesis protein CcdA